jgi:hypothetical protein
MTEETQSGCCLKILMQPTVQQTLLICQRSIPHVLRRVTRSGEMKTYKAATQTLTNQTNKLWINSLKVSSYQHHLQDWTRHNRQMAVTLLCVQQKLPRMSCLPNSTSLLAFTMIAWIQTLNQVRLKCC